jgi:sulfur carrier protein
MVNLKINGKERALREEMLLGTYLNEHGIDPRIIAVEVNGNILQRDEFAHVTLKQGDTVEIVRMIGGGSS